MTRAIDKVPIDKILDRLSSNPYMKDIDRDVVIQKTVEFYSLLNLRDIYEEKNATVKVLNHKGLLPCTLVELIQVKDVKTGFCLTASTDNFMLSEFDRTNSFTFKVQGRVIITSIPECELMVDYLSIPEIEEEPALIDDPLFLLTLELYIKKHFYFHLVELGKINLNVYNLIEQDYYWNAGKLEERYNTPTLSDAQALINYNHRPIWELQSDFVNGYKHANNLHRIRVQ